MNQKQIEKYTVRRPDFIPEKDEHLYPAIGGVFHDYVPEGQDAITMHGYTVDATPQCIEEKECPQK